MSFLEFKVNKYLTLKLEEGNTILYTKGEKFIQCRHLLLIDPQNKENHE